MHNCINAYETHEKQYVYEEVTALAKKDPLEEAVLLYWIEKETQALY